MDIPSYGYVAAIGVIGWAVMVIVGARGCGRSRHGAKTAEIMQENIATNRAVLDKLETIETRLAAVEKTLTDIP